MTGREMSVAADAQNVTVVRGARTAVDRVSCSVQTGAWLCIVGPNGAGKTSLLHALAGLVSFSGSVSYNGAPLQDLPIKRRARLVALVAQDPIIPVGITVADYVLLGRTAHLSRFGVESQGDLAAVQRLLSRLDLDVMAGRVLSTLSGGERQRAAIARALAQQADVLLLDEPTAGLDLRRQLEVLDLIDELRAEQSLTVISTLHDLTLAAQYADQLLLLDSGHVAASGTPDEVLTDMHLQRHYGGRVRVIKDGDNTLVVPLRHA